jgi:hypothetical protein
MRVAPGDAALGLEEKHIRVGTLLPAFERESGYVADLFHGALRPSVTDGYKGKSRDEHSKGMMRCYSNDVIISYPDNLPQYSCLHPFIVSRNVPESKDAPAEPGAYKQCWHGCRNGPDRYRQVTKKGHQQQACQDR